MKVFLLLAVCLLSLHNGNGLKRNLRKGGTYMFVRCNPGNGDANCVTHRTQDMEWSPDRPAKLPASTVQYLDAEPVEDESPAWREVEVMQEEDEDEEQQMEEDEDEELQVEGDEDEELQVEEDEDEELQVEEDDDEEEEEEDEMDEQNENPEMEEEGESPLSPPSEESSGVYEGSTGEGSYTDEVPAESGSGESWTEKQLYKVGDVSSLRRLFPSRSLVGKVKPEDFKQDQILQL